MSIGWPVKSTSDTKPDSFAPTSDFTREMVGTYAINDRMNQLVLDYLDPAAWRAQLPGYKGGRTIAAIFAHMHNIRLKWLRLSAPQLKLPRRLDRASSTQKETGIALGKSAALCCEMLEQALSGVEGLRNSGFGYGDCRVEKFLRDGWAPPWRPGPAMLAYMLVHDAHHRGQICMLSHQLGYTLPVKAGAGMWGWEKLWKECGFKSLAKLRDH